MTYFLDELQARRGKVDLVGICLYEKHERTLVPSWFDGENPVRAIASHW